MLRQNSCRFSYAILTLIIAVTAKPPPVPSPWANYGVPKSVYPKSSGLSGGLDTITVPFGPKVSPFFPKFVDPKTIISTKTDLLNNLLGGSDPVNYPYVSPILYASNLDDESSNDVSDLENILSTAISDDKNIKRSMFGPANDKFGSDISPFGSFAPQFASEYNSPFNEPSSKFDFSSRPKRSTLTSDTVTPINLKPLPPYPGLSPITEEFANDVLPTSTTVDIPKQFLSGMFGPFSPFGFAPAPSIIDPSLFVTKKNAFLNTLFSSLATNTPVASTDTPKVQSTIVPSDFWSAIKTTTATPMPESTIVPPNFWIPSSIIPTPGEYTDKVTKFLDKLVENIKLSAIKTTLNKTIDNESDAPKSNSVRSLIEDSVVGTKINRSIDDLAIITAAKDAIVDSIIGELSSLKTDMINNLDELILAEQLETAKPSFSEAAGGKKSTKPFKSPFAALWGPTQMPTVSTLPFKQKMTKLSEVFDLLTNLQKNISNAVTTAIENRVTATDPPISEHTPITSNIVSPYNISLWDAITYKLASMDNPTMNYGSGKYTRAITKDATQGSSNTHSDTIKRHVDNDDSDDSDNQYYDENRNDYKRGVKMSMRQGYQSMPPGIVESVLVGGGSVPGHQGGGIKLLQSQSNDNNELWNKWAKWGEYIKNQYADHRHHHSHH